MVPRETGNNAYAKFGGTNSLMVFSKVAHCIYSICGFVFLPITENRSNQKKTIRPLSSLN